MDAYVERSMTLRFYPMMVLRWVMYSNKILLGLNDVMVFQIEKEFTQTIFILMQNLKGGIKNDSDNNRAKFLEFLVMSTAIANFPS